jgi:hypothetical protein
VARELDSEARRARLERLGADLALTLRRVARDANRRGELYASDLEMQEDRRALEETAAEGFWARFSTEPLPVLEFLENKVARQVGEGEALTLDYLGTELPRFVGAFPRFELVSGELPPPGTRGILLGHGAYEQTFKHPIAVRLEELRRELQRGNTLAADERLRTLVERNVAELPDLVARLDVEHTPALRDALARFLGHPGELEALLTEFLALDDGNFEARYQFFHGGMKPFLPLYRVKPGDTLTLKNVLERGPGVPVKVWGTFRFQGLGGDTSIVNTLSIVDLVTARHLADRPTLAQQQEARELIGSLGFSASAKDLSTTATFGKPQIVDVEASTPSREAPVFERTEGLSQHFTEEELKGGSVLQAALVLAPGASPDAVSERIRGLAQERKLPLALATWEQVGGFISAALGMSRLLLGVLALLLGGFVLLVSMGTLLLLARERVGEVGTLRAVGMQRRQVLISLLLEGLLLGGVGGFAGSALGAALVGWGARDGLPVRDEALQFFLGGAVLYPRLDAGQVVGVGLGVMLMMGLAGLVPAWRGSSVTPRVAMSRRED